MVYELIVKDLSFSFGSKEVLKNLNMSIKSGAFISIIGPNGSGKSTFLKNISTYLKPQKGIVVLENKDINKLPRKEISKRISMVPQNTALEFDFKVKDMVMMGRYPYIDRFRGETAEDIKIAEKAMAYTNTLILSDRMFNELSGGEKQRVILAQALAQQPNILLLDEPVSHLDLQHQVEILDLIKRMSMQECKTVIAVLHDLNMASVYSNYIVILKEGRIFAEGEPQKVLNSENIEAVFKTKVYISNNPITGRPYIYTLSSIPKPKRKLKIHMICGGGSGFDLIQSLSGNGFEVSTGVLNIGDSDWTISKEYQLDIAEEIPFVDISPNAYERNKELVLKADIIILMPVYFSKANIKNLEILLEEKLEDKKIYIYDDGGFYERDFCDGKASSLYDNIKKFDNVELVHESELVNLLIRLDECYE